MKFFVLGALILITAQLSQAASPRSCPSLFSTAPQAKTVASPDNELARVSSELKRILETSNGPDVDIEIQKLLAGDVQKTLVHITNSMRADDRVMDDLLHGRRNVKSLEVLKSLSDSLTEYRAISLDEKKFAYPLTRLIPKLLERRRAELRAAIPQKTSVIQSVKAELERDTELLKSVREATDAHIAELIRRVALLEELEKQLEHLIPGQSALHEAMVARIRYEILSQASDLKQMMTTSRASIAAIDTVLTNAKSITEGITKQLNVVLPRVAAETKTPSLILNLQSGAEAAAQLRARPEHGDIQAYGSVEDFTQIKKLVTEAKDLNVSLTAFDQILKRQTTELPELIKTVFRGPHSMAFMYRFLETSVKTEWTISMTEVHSLLIDGLLRSKKAHPDTLTKLSDYAAHHAFDAFQSEEILKVLVESKLPRANRLTAALMLVDSPQPQLVEQVANQLRLEKDSSFVEAIENKIKKLQKSVKSSERADSLKRDVELARDAKQEAILHENLGRLKEVEKAFSKIISRKRVSAPYGWTQVIFENPHPLRGQVVANITRMVMFDKYSMFSNAYTEWDLNRLTSEISYVIKSLDLEAQPTDVKSIQKWLKNYKVEPRLRAEKLFLDLLKKEHVEGLKELLDKRIAEVPNGDFQTMLMAKRLEIDKREGGDALTAVYAQRLGSLVIATEPADVPGGRNQNKSIFIQVARTLLEEGLLNDRKVKMKLFVLVRSYTVSYSGSSFQKIASTIDRDSKLKSDVTKFLQAESSEKYRNLRPFDAALAIELRLPDALRILKKVADNRDIDRRTENALIDRADQLAKN